MKEYSASISDIISGKVDCPFPIEDVPNKMGINLSSVGSIRWTKQDDGQLVSVIIEFMPDPQEHVCDTCKYFGDDDCWCPQDCDENGNTAWEPK